MRSTRRARVALVAVAAFGLVACGSSEPAEDAATAAVAVPAEPDPGEAGGAQEREEYWSDDRLAALESAKADYLAPTRASASGSADPESEAASHHRAPAPPAPQQPDSSPVGEPSSASYEIEGYVDVPDHVWVREYSDKASQDGGRCRHEQEGYDDVRSGTQVTVRDGHGQTLAVGELEDGELVSSYEDKAGKAMDCRLPFTVDDVPPAALYAIEVAGQELTYPLEHLQRRGWQVALSLDW